MRNKPIILIIDPALRTSCVEAINCISRIMGELKKHPEFSFSHFEYISPFLSNIRVQNFMRNKYVGAVICLGSIANMTDELPCVSALISDLEKYVFEKNIPFFGICFSHQMFATMHSFKVGYLKERHKIPMGKHHNFREFQILHPKLALLATNFVAKDYYSNNKIDLDFRDVVKITKSWGKEQWDILDAKRGWVLTAQENRVKEHMQKNTVKNIVSHARHEQEVLESPDYVCKTEVVLGATSDLCAYEALVHSSKPLFSVQTHPETSHELDGGYLLIKNFIYMAAAYLKLLQSPQCGV